MKRVAFYMTHPTQYHSPWFRGLAQRTDLDFHVFYGSLPNAEQQGAGFNVSFEWDVPLLEGYPSTVLQNVGSGSITDFSGIDAPEISATVARGGFDAWIINGWRTRGEWRAIESCYRAGVPMFIRGDSTLLDQRSAVRRLAKHFLHRRWIPRFACYLTVGVLNERYYRHFGADPTRFVPVRHFVDNESFARATAESATRVDDIRRDWSIPDGALTLLFAGKFIPKKQPMDAIRAIEQTVGQRNDIHLVMVGDGPLREECERYVSERRLPVTFAGFLNQKAMPDAYAAADILVMPSVRDETWGLVVNEAMASGIPAIVSDMVGCAPDLVIESKTGCVFSAGDIDSLARIFLEYAADRNRAVREGKGAEVRVQEYSLDSAVENTVNAVERFAA